MTTFTEPLIFVIVNHLGNYANRDRIHLLVISFDETIPTSISTSSIFFLNYKLHILFTHELNDLCTKT